MKTALLFFLTLVSLSNKLSGQTNKTNIEEYVLLRVVKKEMTFGGKRKVYKVLEANQKDINRLNEPLRALAAYYSGLAQSDCTDDTVAHNDSSPHIICELTSALGLGTQGSDEQVELIEKWFPNNTTAKEIINDNCWVGVPGSSYFSEYSSLTFTVKRDTVISSYQKEYYDHGKTTSSKHREVFIIKNNEIIFVKDELSHGHSKSQSGARK